MTDEQKNEMKAELQARAEALAACKTTDEFDAYLTEYMKEQTTESGEITEDNIASNLEDTKYRPYSSRTTGQGEWAFADERKVGDTKIIENEDSISYTVVMVERTKFRDEDKTRNVRHILFLTEEHTDAAAR